MAEANLRWKADTAEAIAKTEALKKVVASVGGSSTTNAIKSIGSAWKVVVPAIAAAGVAILALTGNMAVLAPLIPVVTVALTGLLAPFTTLAALVVGFIPPLTLLVGLLGGLGAAFAFAGVQAVTQSKRYTGLAKIVDSVKTAFKGLVAALVHDFMPTFKFLGDAAFRALTYLTAIAKLPLGQAFKSLSTTGVTGLNKFLEAVGRIVSKPIRLAFAVAFGKSDTLRKAMVDDWNDIVNFFVGHKGVLLPVQKWFGKQDFTAVGYRWAAEAAGAFMTGLGMALSKLLSSRGGQLILGGAGAGTLIGGAIGGPMGAAAGAAFGVAFGIALNHYWTRIATDASKAVKTITAEFQKVGAFLKKAIGPTLWNELISLAHSFWDTLKSIGGYIQNHIYPVVRHVWNAIGGWHTVLVAAAIYIRVLVAGFVAVALVVRTIYNAIQTMIHWIQRAANAVKGQFTGSWDEVKTAVGAVASAISTIVSGIETAVSAASKLAAVLGQGGSSNLPVTGAGGGRFGHRAMGGPVSPGTSYVVGERGPELFTPRSGGMITPHGAGGPSIVMNFYGLDDAHMRQAAAKLQRYMNVAQARRA